MKLPSSISILTTIFGLSLTVLSYSTPLKAATFSTDSGMMGMDSDMESNLGAADDQFDLRFIDDMTMHHQSAIEMAQEALNDSQRSEILQLSQEIIDTQGREIEQMQEWRQAWYPNAGSTMDMDGEHMMVMDLGPADNQFDLRFIDAMSEHHQTAINSAQEALIDSERPEILQLSQDIIIAQTREIAQLQEWRQDWYPDADSAVAVPESTPTVGLLAFGAFGIASMLKSNRRRRV